MTDHGVIIVGAGQAGCAAAAKLRNLGYGKPITLIPAAIENDLCRHPPRPPLPTTNLATMIDMIGVRAGEAGVGGGYG